MPAHRKAKREERGLGGLFVTLQQPCARDLVVCWAFVSHYYQPVIHQASLDHFTMQVAPFFGIYCPEKHHHNVQLAAYKLEKTFAHTLGEQQHWNLNLLSDFAVTDSYVQRTCLIFTSKVPRKKGFWSVCRWAGTLNPQTGCFPSSASTQLAKRLSTGPVI